MESTVKTPIVEIKNMTMRFGDFVANSNINLKIYAGTIQAIVGENGAGKSTLMKVLYGVYKPSEGEIYIDGTRKQLHPPARAIAEGIGMVFQDFRLIPAFTALENILLALPNKKQGNRAGIRKEILEVSKKYNIPIDPDMYVWKMDLGQRQRVEIIKVLLMKNTRVLIFDEPTSVLTENEVASFIKLLMELRDNGYGILFITHKLNETMACADTITVLRRGQITNVIAKEDGYNRNALVWDMMGSEAADKVIDYESFKMVLFDSVDPAPGLSCEKLNIIDDHGQEIISDINFNLRRGEIYGLAGISGRGQRELLETLFGLRVPYGGILKMLGDDVTKAGLYTRLDRGMAFISEDPIRDNVVPGLNIYEHMVLAGVSFKHKGFSIDWDAIQETLKADKTMQEMGVPEIDRRLETLSGGNVQRTVFARAIMKAPSVLLASYPSRGLDIGTVMTVHKILIRLKEQGCSILLISEDLSELFDLSDRIGVIANNRIYGPYDPKVMTQIEIGDIMLGGEKGAA